MARKAGRIGSKQNRIALGSTLNPLINRRQKATPVGVAPPIGLHTTRNKHDKTREVLVFRTQSIRHPRTQGGATRPRGTRVDEQFSRSVIELIGMHGTDHAKLIGHPLEIG